MDSNKVDYSGKPKEAGKNDKLLSNATKVPATYVFKPEVVKSRSKDQSGLRGLLDRVAKSRDTTERRRSRSLFLAHDHSKESGKLEEYRAGGRFDRRNVKNHTNIVPRGGTSINPKFIKSLELERSDEYSSSRSLENKSVDLSRRKSCPKDRTVERHGKSADHLETCQEEEYRENGELRCSSTGSKRQDDRDGKRMTKSSEEESPPQPPVPPPSIDEEYARINRSQDDGQVDDRECRRCSPRNRVECTFRRGIPRPDAHHEQRSRRSNPIKSFDSSECDEGDKTAGTLRRVDSPYPYATNHNHGLSPSSRYVTSVDTTPGYLLTRQSIARNDSVVSPISTHSDSTLKTLKDCDNLKFFRSIANDKANDGFSTIEIIGSAKLASAQRKTETGRTNEFEKKTGHCAVSDPGGFLYRSRSSPQLSVHDSGVASGNGNIPGRPTSRFVADLRQLLTLKQHYYPEGGWGWVIVVVGVLVQILSHGIHGSVGVFVQQVQMRFESLVYLQSGWLGAMSTGVALLISPVTIAFCRKKSTRVTAVLGGLVTALGCLFTSFASQFHQLFFSYGTVVGIGVGMTRDCSTLMVAQYFKRRREFVEIFIVSGSGLGIAVMSAFIKGSISKIGWRLGLQAVTGVVFLTFILGTFYRSASLYHPQRRAILHLKNQKRKIKDKNRADNRPPFFDFSTLKSKTVRILLVSTGISAFGINTPIFYLAHQAEEEGLGDTVILLQTYLGLAWTLGCVTFGLLVVHHSVECRIARQYLTQAAVFMCGLCILALTAVHGNYHGYVMFTWIYGIFCGGYHYSLKMYTFERVRARNFARTWGFVQCSQAIPIAIGVPISGYMNVGCGGKAGYYFSSTCVLVGSFTLFFIDLHRRNLSRHKHTRANGTRHLCVSDNCPHRRRLSFTQDPENEGVAAGAAAAALMLGADLAPGPGEIIDALGADKAELTCISEEGIADMDLPDNLLDDLDYIGDCITSCNKVENYLMLSEFENNLIAEMPIIMDRKGRRWSLARSKPGPQGSQSANDNGNADNGFNDQSTTVEEDDETKLQCHLAPAPNNRIITVIDETST